MLASIAVDDLRRNSSSSTCIAYVYCDYKTVCARLQRASCVEDFHGDDEFCVYLKVLGIYRGSSINMLGGDTSLKHYVGYFTEGKFESSMPKLLPQLKENGWERLGGFVIAAVPIPDDNNSISYARGLIVLLESLFTALFWFHASNTSGSITQFKSWAKTDTQNIWRGACSRGSALKEAWEGRKGNPLTETYNPELLQEIRDRLKERERLRGQKRRTETRLTETVEEKATRQAKHNADATRSKAKALANQSPEEIEGKHEEKKSFSRSVRRLFL